MNMVLPPRSALVWTNIEDPVNYYYYPVIRHFYRQRLQLVLEVMDNRQHENLMDVGYGCGIMYPSLQAHARELWGVETHDKLDEVEASMKRLGVSVNLLHGTIHDLSGLKTRFDAVLLISVLEHVSDLATAIDEIASIQPENGSIYVGSPVKSRLTDLIFKVLRFDANKYHVNSHRDIITAIERRYKIRKFLTYPRGCPLDYAFYFACEAVKK